MLFTQLMRNDKCHDWTSLINLLGLGNIDAFLIDINNVDVRLVTQQEVLALTRFFTFQQKGWIAHRVNKGVGVKCIKYFIFSFY